MPSGRCPGAPTLLLIPTALEERSFRDGGELEVGLALRALCGFGPIAAAARTAQLVRELGPRRVVLAGIAGTYDENALPLGAAACFAEVALDGVGAGAGRDFTSGESLGFSQWPGGHGTGAAAIRERIALDRPSRTEGAGLLVTACAAAGDGNEAAWRRERFAGAVAEDMEGFGVALACALFDVPLCIVRGASNRVGERDAKRWRIVEALAAARAEVRRVLSLAWEAPG